MIQIASIIMFFIAFFGLITSRHIIKSVIFLILKETAIIVFFLSLTFRRGMLPPIGLNLADDITLIADPLPQAMMITAIVIGLAVTAVDITMIMYLTRQTKSVDWIEVEERCREMTEEVM
jgi:multicomponent Na+:H+ antiporter subunit C